MSANSINVSPRLQALINKGVLDRLPVTFSAFCFDQMKDWSLLFPAEQNYFERLFLLLDRSKPEEVDRLFATMREIEPRMGVNEKNWPRREFTLDQVDFLNRNPIYPEWRKAVTEVFARLDPLLDAEVARSGHPRLAVIIAPSELPVGPDRMWLRIQERGKRIAIAGPENVADFVPLLLTGQAAGKSSSILSAAAKTPYDSWVVEAGSRIGSMDPPDSSAVRCSYGKLDPYRRRLMTEVNKMVKTEEIRGPRQLSARLRQMKILASEGDAARDPVLAEFVRASLLSGNGTLLVNNTFVEWASVQAIRRARPSLMVIGYGIRNKIKPFSSLLIYEDQEAASPVPNQMDTLGSYIDLEVFHQYIWQEFEKYAEYRNNTAYLFIGEGMDEMLVIAPPDCPVRSAKPPLALPDLHRHMKEWMNL